MELNAQNIWPLLIPIFLFAIVPLFLSFTERETIGDRKQSYLESLSSKLLIQSKRIQNDTKTEHIREINPNDFEFEKTLRDILEIIQNDRQRIVVVLDNIDRLPSEDINEYWALVRSVFSRGQKLNIAERAITVIVPYDRSHIEVALASKVQKDTSTLTKISSRELFFKTSDEVLTISPPVLSNTRDFFTEKLSDALSISINSDDQFRTYRIFVELIRLEGETATPRQVISFINELTYFFVLHDGQFSLPTLACYLAHKDKLDAEPISLAIPNTLNSKIEGFANDPKLRENLAAIVFNVEPELALQILLDEKINTAIVADSSENLLTLSKAAGFDLRVTDVVEANSKDWQSTNEIGKVISNLVALANDYKGSAKDHFSKAITETAQQQEVIELAEASYSPFIELLEIAPETQHLKLSQDILASVINWFKDVETITFQHGREFSGLIYKLKEQLRATSPAIEFNQVISQTSLLDDPSFLTGFASALHPDDDVRLKDFSAVKIALGTEGQFLRDVSKEYPDVGLSAFSEFSQAGIINQDDWILISNAALAQASTEEGISSIKMSNLMNLCSEAYKNVEKVKRVEIDIKPAFSDGNFYINLKSSADDSQDSPLAHAYFLAGQKYFEETLSCPKVLKANTYVKIAEDEFAWFESYFTGESAFSDDQIELVASLARDCANVMHWVSLAKKNPENQSVLKIVKSALNLEPLPFLALSAIQSEFEYFRGLLSDDQFRDFLQKFDPRIKSEDIAKLAIEKCPVGILALSHEIGTENWAKYHERIGALLQAIPNENWSDSLTTEDHTAAILMEKISSSGFEFSSTEFRDLFIKVTQDVLNNNSAPDISDKSLGSGLITRIVLLQQVLSQT